ncbi:MAG: carboxyl transferase domain-containing protein, partial [Thermomicrobiales bacterium]
MTTTRNSRDGAAAQAFLEGAAVPVLPTNLNAADPQSEANREHMRELVEGLQAALRDVRDGGGKLQTRRHKSRGKLTARERIHRLLDPGTAFLELSPLAAWQLYGGEAPAAGIVTGVGRITGRECVIVANDATVKGGTYYPLTVKKHLRAQEI